MTLDGITLPIEMGARIVCVTPDGREYGIGEAVMTERELRLTLVPKDEDEDEEVTPESIRA